MCILDQVLVWMKAPLLAHFWAGSAFTWHFRRWARGLGLLGDGWLSLWWCGSPLGLVLTCAHTHTHRDVSFHVGGWGRTDVAHSLVCWERLSDLTWLSSQNTSEPQGDDGYLLMWENSRQSVWVQCRRWLWALLEKDLDVYRTLLSFGSSSLKMGPSWQKHPG